MTGTSRPAGTGSELHPPWCVRKRCEFINPPSLGLVLPRHQGAVVPIGNRRPESGAVMTWLMGRPGFPLLVAVHAASRVRGSGGAELPVADAWRLARRLDQLVIDAGFTPPMEG